MSETNYFPWRVGDPERYLRDASSLAKALNELPGGCKTTVNAVGNLAIVNSDGEQIGELTIRKNGEDVFYD